MGCGGLFLNAGGVFQAASIIIMKNYLLWDRFLKVLGGSLWSLDALWNARHA